MATVSSLVDRVRAELGDLGKSFVTQFVADGTTNRFKLHYAPLDGQGVYVSKNGVDISLEASVEESTGVLVLDEVPVDGDELLVSGNYYRYFTTAELERLVSDALEQHTAHHHDATGRKVTPALLPVVEEYPVAIYATTLALYTLATDSAFDIDILAPDGVNIPRSERYRQLMQMVETRQQQYRELCAHLGIGMYKIDVFNLRRISKTTNRFVPMYKGQEVDDRSFPQRIDLVEPTYGDSRLPWPTAGGELTAYQGIAYIGTITFKGDFTGKSFIARLVQQRGSVQVVQNFNLSLESTGTGESTSYVATISLTADQTRRLALRTYWQILSVDDVTDERIEVVGDNFFTERSSAVIL